VLQRAAVHIGKSQATLTGTYQERGESTELKMNLSGTSMAATDLAALLPALNVVLPAGSSIQTGTLNMKLLSEGPADKLVTSGNIAFTNLKLAGFDLGQKMAVVEKLATLTSSSGNNLSVPFTIQGSSSNPIFRPDVKTIVNTQLKEAGTKAVGSFLNNLLNGKKKSEEQ